MTLPPSMISPWPVEDEPDPTKVRVYINGYGVKQYTNDQGDDACLACALPFTNRGDGMLCPYCYGLIKNNLDELLGDLPHVHN